MLTDKELQEINNHTAMKKREGKGPYPNDMFLSSFDNLWRRDIANTKWVLDAHIEGLTAIGGLKTLQRMWLERMGIIAPYSNNQKNKNNT
jgi:hypothetical protein